MLSISWLVGAFLAYTAEKSERPHLCLLEWARALKVQANFFGAQDLANENSLKSAHSVQSMYIFYNCENAYIFCHAGNDSLVWYDMFFTFATINAFEIYRCHCEQIL
jgi:hypothetical protein